MITALRRLASNPVFQKTKAAVRVLSLLVTAFILGPVTFTAAPTSGLDPSYQIGLLHALIHGLEFGTEFVFTYGPLAFALTRVAPASLQWGILLIDAALFLTLLHLLWRTGGSLRSFLTYLLMPVAAIPLAGDIYAYQEVTVWFALLGFYLFLYLEERRRRDFAAAAAISILMLYLKLNFGLVTVPLMTAFLLYCIAVEPDRIRYIGYLTLYLVVLIVSARLLNVALPQYLEAGWHLADGFNDAMYLDSSAFGFAADLSRALWFIAAFALLSVLRLKWILTDRKEFIRAAFTALFLYLLFKQAFVRADAHALLFPQFAAVVILPFAVFSRGFMKAGAALLLLAAVALSAHQGRARYHSGFLSAQAKGVQSYCASAARRAEPNFDQIPPIAYFPAQFKEIVGNATIDIMPWESSIAYFHRLSYAPRPVFQSYHAYDEYLDTLNAEFYRSERAPRFVLFQLACIDDRYCFGDEVRTKLALLERYTVRARSEPFLLLERRAVPVRITESVSDSGTIPLTQRITVREAQGPTVLRLEARYSLLGKLRRLLFQPPRINVKLYPASGGTLSYRGIVPILRGGIIANFQITSLDDAERFFSGRFEDIPRIGKISLETQSRRGFDQIAGYSVEKWAPQAQP